jgi:hypothetical protein
MAAAVGIAARSTTGMALLTARMSPASGAATADLTLSRFRIDTTQT